FFFSSRRRHTRFSRDWSSDVCSSDLTEVCAFSVSDMRDWIVLSLADDQSDQPLPALPLGPMNIGVRTVSRNCCMSAAAIFATFRSVERRVGKILGHLCSLFAYVRR